MPPNDLRTMLTWEVTDRATGRLVSMFTGDETKPDAIRTACAMGHDPFTCDVRAAMPEPVYLAAHSAGAPQWAKYRQRRAGGR